jgi:pimeloyl-ACP methyl ester carboxylesterase
MAPTPGILYVTMQPRDSLPPAQFHDWYNNEHGPGRLRLKFCHNGFRYRASDISSSAPASETRPEWMAIYDLEDMDYLTQDVYTSLRKEPVQTQRERDTMKKIKVDRKFYDFVKEWKASDFKKLENVASEGEGNVMIHVGFTLQSGEDKEKELEKWYNEEHVSMLQKVPGWRRTRRFVTSYLDLQDGKPKEFIALHEYAPKNGLGGPEFQAAVTTPWTEKISASVVQEKRRRVYDLYYTFGPAPRDLTSLWDPEALHSWSTDARTVTKPAHITETHLPEISSFITTPDSLDIHYVLTGSSAPDAPLLVLCNSILTMDGIWEPFIKHFLSLTKNKFRVLRYNTRGRYPLGDWTKKPITVDTLTQDVISMMDALRAKTAYLVGVSVGGATVLNAALTYPDRIKGFVACDTNSVAPAGNRKAWGERIEVAEKEGAVNDFYVPMVGNELAEMTVRRWFTEESYRDEKIKERIEQVRLMVRGNSLEGFKDSVHALYEYDFRQEMAGFKGKGAFLVGAKDGVLPKTMAEMAKSLGEGVELKVVEGAGHLPMVEKPEEVAKFVAQFLEYGNFGWDTIARADRVFGDRV